MKITHVILLALSLTLSACASWQAPTIPADTSLRDRAVEDTIGTVTVRSSVLSAEDNQQYFGVNLNEQNIQTVWVEVENQSGHTLWLLSSGTDPNYFAPLEVAWPFHRKFDNEYNRQVDDHFDNLAFRNPIPPGSTQSGFLYTNPHHRTRVLNVDLLGQEVLFPFTLFPPVPEEVDKELLAEIMRLLEIARQADIEDEDSFRDMLEQLPCCADPVSGKQGEPINVIFIGEFMDMASALVRRGYRANPVQDDDQHQYHGRGPDVVMRKRDLGHGSSNWLRAWVAPFTYRQQPVLLIQAGRPIGGRFHDTSTQETVLHPDIDEVRNVLIQDMMYSGGLSQLGFVAGVPPVTDAWRQANADSLPYHTDGLRAVMFMITRPLSLEDVELLDWVPYLQRREDAASSELNADKEHEQAGK